MNALATAIRDAASQPAGAVRDRALMQAVDAVFAADIPNGEKAALLGLNLPDFRVAVAISRDADLIRDQLREAINNQTGAAAGPTSESPAVAADLGGAA